MTDKRKLRAGIRVNTPSVKIKKKAETKPKTVKTIVEEPKGTTETAATTE